MFLSKRLAMTDLATRAKLGLLVQYFDWPLPVFNLTKTDNGQSKYCINCPKFTEVVRSITASLFDNNILFKQIYGSDG